MNKRFIFGVMQFNYFQNDNIKSSCFRIVLMICIQINLFGATVVDMLLASENIQSLIINNMDVTISFCYWLFLITGVLIPLSWLGTPKDIW